jgi:RNA polymerase sigma-70 factor (ECF subfamily)
MNVSRPTPTESTGDSGAGISVGAALDPDEIEAVLGTQRGDRTAFEMLVRRYMRRASYFALGWTGSREEALDASQEAFVRAYRAIGMFDPSRPFYPWFHQILRNVCLTNVSRRARSREVPLEDTEDRYWAFPQGDLDTDPHSALERAEMRRLVWEALHHLRPPDREILILREFQQLSYAEIAEVLEIPQGTVMSRLHAARARLREALEPLLSADLSVRRRPIDPAGGAPDGTDAGGSK